MFPNHPDIERTLRTGYPYPIKPLFCVDCGCELTGDIFISDGDVICEGCTRDRILSNYNTAGLAAVFDIQQTTVENYLRNQEGS